MCEHCERSYDWFPPPAAKPAEAGKGSVEKPASGTPVARLAGADGNNNVAATGKSSSR